MKQDIIISGFHIRSILDHAEGDLEISLDLGMSHSTIHKSKARVLLPDGQSIPVEKLERAARRHNNEDCFIIRDGSLFYIYRFNGRSVYRLYEPKKDWPPTLWINGSMMHTVSVSKPTDEAREKASELGRHPGRVLETCFGLGYASEEMAGLGAKSVTSYEISSDVLDMTRENPWSKAALSDSKIQVSNSDVAESVLSIDEGSFDSILHDPPNVKIEGDLYSLKFYTELCRVLRKGGTLYHFVGGGKTPHEYKVNYTRGVMRRLSLAGFTKVSRAYRGVKAVK